MRTVRPHHCKVTPEQKQQLLSLYIEGGLPAVAELSKQLGVSPRYICGIASILGIHRPKWRKGFHYKDRRVDVSTRTEGDPRWLRAIERGSVVA